MRGASAGFRWLVTLFGLGVAIGGWTGAESGRAADPATATDDVQRWVNELDSEQFVVRETATARLIRAGRPAVEPIVSRAGTSSLESASRGIHVLRELALSTDEELAETARNGLVRIAAIANSSAARRAEQTLESLNEAKQKRAIDELQRLGAKVGDGQVQFAAQMIERVFSIEIGPTWRGEDRDLQRLKWLYEVRHVTFSGNKVTDHWMKYLAGMNQLASLTLTRTGVTDEGLESIRELPKLQVIWIKYSPIGDKAVEHLRTLKQATFIKLYGTNITKEAVRSLQDSLATAKIDYRKGGFLGVNCQAHPLGCEVIVVQPNSAAMDAGLESSDVILKYGDRKIESFETLTTHISENSPGDEVALELVRNARVRRGGAEKTANAKLGITGRSNALGIEIMTVEPDSFVAGLELKPGDVITGCDEKRVHDLAELTAGFTAAKVGEKLQLDFVRAATLITKTVKLGAWE